MLAGSAQRVICDIATQFSIKITHSTALNLLPSAVTNVPYFSTLGERKTALTKLGLLVGSHEVQITRRQNYFSFNLVPSYSPSTKPGDLGREM